jgi:hypothetical protein
MGGSGNHHSNDPVAHFDGSSHALSYLIYDTRCIHARHVGRRVFLLHRSEHAVLSYDFARVHCSGINAYSNLPRACFYLWHINYLRIGSSNRIYPGFQQYLDWVFLRKEVPGVVFRERMVNV